MKEPKTILLAGAGAANLEVMIRARDLVRAGARLLLVSADTHWYSPQMAAEVMSGDYGLKDFRLDLADFARRMGVEFLHDEITSLLPKQKKVLTAAGRLLSYDAAAFALGSLALEKDRDVPPEGSFPVRPVRNVLEIRNEVETLLELFPQKPLDVVVLGGGPCGVEYALNTAALLHERRRPRTEPGWSLILMEREARVLPGLPEAASRIAARSLALHDVQVRTHAEVLHVQSRRVVLEYGETLDFDIAIVATGRRVAELFSRAQLATDEAGAVYIEHTLAVTDAKDVFATGECCRYWHEPAEPQAQGPLLARNLLAWLQGQPLKSGKTRRAWQCLSLGPDSALAVKGRRVLHGAWLRKYKRWHEQRAIRRLQQA